MMNIRRESITILCSIILLLLLFAPARGQHHFFDECSSTEVWMPLGNGIHRQAIAATVMNGRLYVVHYGMDTSYWLSAWDGREWEKISSFNKRQPGAISDIVAYKGQLYMSGRFTSINGLPQTDGLARWNGTAWERVPGNQMANGRNNSAIVSPFQMTVYRDELIMFGQFRDAGGDTSRGITAWNGSGWRTLAESKVEGDSLLGVTSYVEWRGDLYVSGFFSELQGVPVKGIARWDGNNWSAVGNQNMLGTLKLVVLNDQLHAIGNSPDERSNIWRWDGTSWTPLPDIFDPRAGRMWLLSAIVMNEQLYMIAAIVGQGTFGVRWDGTQAHHLATPDYRVDFLLDYRGDILAGGEFTRSCGVPLNNVAGLCRWGDCIGISGRVINDASGICDGSSHAPGVPGRIIELLPGPRYAITDDNGYYRFNAEPGEYTLRMAPAPHWQQTCPGIDGTRSVTITGATGSSVYNNFAAERWPRVLDVRVDIVDGIARPGRVMSYVAGVSNTGTATASSGVLRLYYDRSLTIEGSSPPYTRALGGMVEWDLPDIPIGDRKNFRLDLKVPTTMQAGTMLCASSFVNLHGDAVRANNYDSICRPVVASYDPNDIAVHPMGRDASGTISPTDTVLTYTVRFQNTGNDTAFRVVVFDTLTQHLDLTTLRPGASSHLYELKLGQKGELIWDFQDIGLPSSKQNEAGSQGMFKFAVRLQKNLPPNTRIPNRASIYFDYNKPIHTNTVVSIIEELPSGVDEESPAMHAMFFPNPARSMLYVKGEIVRGSTVEVSNLLGERIMTIPCDGSGDMMFDVSHLSSGKYLVSIMTRGGREIHGITIMR